MANPDLLLGIDISTTGAKALLMDSGGRVIRSATTPLALSTPRPQWAEQQPEEWWQGIVRSIREIMAQSGVPGGRIAAIGLTGQMHGLVLLDDDGKVLRPAILWNDQRTAAECDAIRTRVGKAKLLAITGNDALAGFTAPKLLWVRQNEPQIFARVRHILLPKDFIRYRLTTQYATDVADASGTLLLDLRARSWSRDMTNALEIPQTWLPTLHEGPQVTNRLSPVAAAVTGLAAGTPVVAGGGDQAAGAVGVGVIEPGVVALSLGTSGVVFAPTQSPLIEPEGRLHAFCHAVPGRWHLMGVMLSAGGSLQWYRDTLAPGVPFETLLAEAETAPPGSEGLLFLPYLSGERTPHPDPLARGAFVGLTLRHKRAHMTRAVLEGVAFGYKDSFDLMRQAGMGIIEQARISGGGARSRFWRQILANTLRVDLVSVQADEGAAAGAAMLAGVGVGVWPDVRAACAAAVHLGERVQPDPRLTMAYARLHARYQALYPALKPTFDGLSEM